MKRIDRIANPAGVRDLAEAPDACGGTKDQWASHAAPCSIQRRSSSFCSAVSFLCDLAGGIISRARSLTDALIELALVRLARGPTVPVLVHLAEEPLSACRAAGRPCGLAESGPWQAKQLSERIGRMSRLNRIVPGFFSSAVR